MGFNLAFNGSKFRHWSLDGSTFVAQAPQFSWMTQFRNGYRTVCVDTNDGAGKSLNIRPTTWIRHLRTFISSPKMEKKTSSCQDIPITWWCQAWGVCVAVWSGSPPSVYRVLRNGFSAQTSASTEKLTMWKNKWIKRHIAMWSYLVAIKYGTVLSDFPSYTAQHTCNISVLPSEQWNPS